MTLSDWLATDAGRTLVSLTMLLFCATWPIASALDRIGRALESANERADREARKVDREAWRKP